MLFWKVCGMWEKQNNKQIMANIQKRRVWRLDSITLQIPICYKFEATSVFYFFK